MEHALKAKGRILFIVSTVFVLSLIIFSGCSSGSSSSQTGSSKVNLDDIVSTYYASNKPSKAGSVQSDWYWYSSATVQGVNGTVYPSDTCLKELYVTSSTGHSATKIGCLHIYLDPKNKMTGYETDIYEAPRSSSDLEMYLERFSNDIGQKFKIHSYLYYVQYFDGSTWGYEGLGSKLDITQMNSLIEKGILYDLGSVGYMKLG